MFKKGNTILNDLKGGLFPGIDPFEDQPSLSKELNEETYYTNKSSNINNNKNNIDNFYRTNTTMYPPKSNMLNQQFAEIKRKNGLKDKKEKDVIKKTSQKEINLKNFPSNLKAKSPDENAKTIDIHNYPSNRVYNNNNIIKIPINMQNQNNIESSSNKIKNIPISLKRVNNIYNKRSLSRNSQSARNNTEPYIHKSPFQKRKSSINSDRNKNKIQNENKNININSDTNLFSSLNQSPKRPNYIPKPNIPKAKNSYNNNNNIIIGNKKIDKDLVNQSKEIKKQYGKENQLLRKKNMYHAVKIQSFFRGYLTRKKLDSLINNCIRIKNGIHLLQRIFSNKKNNILNIINRYNKNNNNSYNLRNKSGNNQISLQNSSILRLKTIENHFKNTNIDKINRIIINIPKIQIFKNNINLLIKRKYILKYLLYKKETELNKKLKYNFEKYKKNVLYLAKQEKDNNKNNNSKELILKKLRDIVRKKIFKNREILRRIFIKYYYNSLYIHLNWYMYVVNQLTYTQNLYSSYNNNIVTNTNTYNTYTNTYTNTNTNTNNNVVSNNDPDPFEQFNQNNNNNDNNGLTNEHSSGVDDALRESIMTIKKINESNNKDEAFRESIMTINKINDELSKEAKEKKKLERNKHLKDLIVKRLKELKNQKHRFFTKFYYQGVLAEKDKKNQENNENNEKKDNAIVISGEIENNNAEIKSEKKGPTRLRGRRKDNRQIKENKENKENNENKENIEIKENKENKENNEIKEDKENNENKEKKDSKEDIALNRRNKARNLRKLMMKKEKEKMEKLRFYFYKFHSNGMLYQLKRNAKLTSKNLLVYQDIHHDGGVNIDQNKIEEKELTLLDKKLLEKRLEEEKLYKQKIEILKTIFYKLDRQYMLYKRKIFEKWNLRAKILSLSKISKNDLKKSQNKKKKKLKKSVRTKKDNQNETEEKKEIEEKNVI